MTIPRGAEFPNDINKLNMAPKRNSFHFLIQSEQSYAWKNGKVSKIANNTSWII